MGKKQINVRVDEEKYEVIERRAAALGMEVNAYVQRLATDEGDELRLRFLDTVAHFTHAWGPDFAEHFGHDVPGAKPPHGQAAA
ncbi:plasmid mobilization protein [Streptomyces fractus]|uniref:plasmid mobilization protein n=1 Tax=Streptomyces fractus TaxID=641806 RepID=UPI003CE6B990